MAPNPLKGVRCFTSHKDHFLYLDFGRKYYSLHDKEWDHLVEDDISEDGLLIGPKVIVEWSK
jgi:hypothetical protein